MNLLSNALDAVAPKTGLIPGLSALTTMRIATPRSRWSTTAPGIEPSMMKHMFQLFHSTKGNRGTGLGLAVAKKIVEEHEGSIGVRSTPGEGTTLQFICRSCTRIWPTRRRPTGRRVNLQFDWDSIPHPWLPAEGFAFADMRDGEPT